MTYVSIDIEVWEQDTKNAPVLEVGVAWVESSASQMVEVSTIMCTHYIIQENAHLRNGRYCADNQDRFNFGASEVICEPEVATRLGNIFDKIRNRSQRVCLVGHNVQQDIKWLATLGCATLLQLEVVCDVGMAFQAQMGLLQARKLSKMMDFYEIQYSNLHNGANDAFYTLELFLCMVEQVQGEKLRKDSSVVVAR
jgi:DNA polymerase III epsilon subunit-like protein